MLDYGKKEYFKDHEWKYLIYLRYGNTLTNQQNAGGSNRAREYYQYSLSKSTTSTCSTRVPIPSSSTNARTNATTGIAHYKLRVICNYSILGSCNFLILFNQFIHYLIRWYKCLRMRRTLVRRSHQNLNHDPLRQNLNPLQIRGS